MRCVHCEKSIKSNQTSYTYPKSKATAHRDCVSVVSAGATDELLLTRQAVAAAHRAERDALRMETSGNTRRVYSTDRPGEVAPFSDNTRTGRVRPSRSR